MHDVLTWCLFTLLSLYLLTTAVGRIMSGVGNVLGTTAWVGQGVSAVAPEAAQAVKQEAQELLAQTGKEEWRPENLKNQAQHAGDYLEGASGNAASNPQNDGQSLDQAIDSLFGQGKEVVSQVDRDAAINVVVARTGKSRQEAAQVLDNWISSYQNTRTHFNQTKEQARQKAMQISDQAAKATSKAGIYGFL